MISQQKQNTIDFSLSPSLCQEMIKYCNETKKNGGHKDKLIAIISVLFNKANECLSAEKLDSSKIQEVVQGISTLHDNNVIEKKYCENFLTEFNNKVKQKFVLFEYQNLLQEQKTEFLEKINLDECKIIYQSLSSDERAEYLVNLLSTNLKLWGEFNDVLIAEYYNN